MSQPIALPTSAPGVPTGEQAARLTAANTDGETGVDSLHLEDLSATAGSQPGDQGKEAGPHDSKPTESLSKPCSYFSLFRYADRVDVLCMVVGAAGAAVSGATLPVFAYLFGRVINNIGALTGGNLISNVNQTVLYFVYLAIGTFIASYLEMFLWMLSGMRQTVQIRQRYLTSALRQEISFFDTQATTGDLLQGLNELTNTIQSGIGEKAGNTIHLLATFATGFAIAFTQGWDMTLVLLAVTPLLAIVGTAVALVLGRMDTRANAAYAGANGIVQESLANVRTVVAFNGQEQTVRRYLNALTMPVRVGVRSGFLNGLTVGSTNFAFLGAYALALWYGGLRIRDGAYNGGKVLSVLLSALLGGFALGQAAPNFRYFARARAAGGKCFALIERKPQLHSPDMYVPVDADASGSATLELRGVDFAYPTRTDVMVACDLNILVSAGHTVALVGESGSGKSTAVQLAQRFYDPIRGQVLLDGRDIRGVPVGWLRSQLALVSQEPALFACTIRENIMYGNPEATQEDVERAARDANAHNFIVELPKGYDTLVGEKGAAISGGQKQRIAIARAIVRNPRLLLLDEATAALDARSERIVQAALERLMQGRTTLLVAHRLSTVINANKIFVMSKGKVVESGCHADLMSKDGGAYATLMRLQQSLPQSDAADMKNPHMDTAETLHVGQDARGAPQRRLPEEYDGDESQVDTASTVSLDDNASLTTVGTLNTDAGLLGADAVRPAGMRPQLTPYILDSVDDIHDTAKAESIRTVDLDDASVTVSRVHQIPKEMVVVERDDSARDSPPAKKKLFFFGRLKKHSDSSHGSGDSTGMAKKASKGKKNKQEKGRKGKKSKKNKANGNQDDSLEDSKDNEPIATASFPRLLSYNKKEWRSAMVGCLASAGLGVVAPIFAIAMATIVSVFYTTNFPYMKSTISLWAGIYGVIGFASLCLSILQQGLFTLMGQKLTRRLRKLMFAAALNQEIGWFDREENQSGALASRLAVDTSRIRGAVGDQLGLLAQNLVTLIAAYIIAFIASWKMTLVITATIPFIVIAGYFQAKFILGSNSKAEKVFDQANQMAAEAFINIRIIAAFMLEGRISRLYQMLLASPARDSFNQSVASGAGYAIGQCVVFLVYAISFWYGGRLVGMGDISFESMLKVFFAITLAAVGFSQAQIAFPDITKASSAIGKVFTTIDRTPKIRDGPDVHELDNVVGHVSLRKVSFAYPQRREVLVLRNFSLEAPAGRTLALVGPSGNGKSTIVSLIERFYDPLSGQVMVDGTDLTKLPLKWWRSNIGLVSQEPILFGGTIYDNITFGQQDVDPERVGAACETANAMSFIRSAPDGLDTKIGEGGGIQLSGGQKQRIAIARAVLRDPKILLLDEATSALDAVSEQVVQQALNRVSQGRTTITIAHRLSTIWDSDSIAVIQSGCVLEQGTHQELSQIPGGAYSSLLTSQQAGFALSK